MHMRKVGYWILSIFFIGVLIIGCKTQEVEHWKVTCPWAENGVAARVNQKTANMAEEVSRAITLEAVAIKGDAKTVNQWVAQEDANSNALVFAGEGLFAITPITNPDTLEFSYEDFVFVENLYSSIFVMSARKDLNLTSVMDVQMYMSKGAKVKVAVNGKAGSESFLTYAFFGSMSHLDEVELVVCNSAAEAAEAVAEGRADFAVSHQSQILDAYESGKVNVICAFDGEDIAEGPFAGVEGVGKYGYPYFRNRCFIMAPKGVNTGKITQVKNMYHKLLEQEEIIDYYEEMMIEVDPMTEQEVVEELENVRNIVNGYRTFFE